MCERANSTVTFRRRSALQPSPRKSSELHAGPGFEMSQFDNHQHTQRMCSSIEEFPSLESRLDRNHQQSRSRAHVLKKACNRGGAKKARIPESLGSFRQFERLAPYYPKHPKRATLLGQQPPKAPRVCLWALVMGPFDSGGVCSMGPYLVYGI